MYRYVKRPSLESAGLGDMDADTIAGTGGGIGADLDESESLNSLSPKGARGSDWPVAMIKLNRSLVHENF